MPPKKKKGAGNGGVVPPRSGRFSKTNQPSPKAKSAGKKEWWDRRKLKDNINLVFARELGLVNGKKIIGYEALALKLRNYLLGDPKEKEKKMSDAQAACSLKFLQFISEKSDAATVIPPADSGAESGAGKKKLTFPEFCEAVGYPKPFAKQIEFAEFVLQPGAGQGLGARGYGKTDYGVITNVSWWLDNISAEDTFLLVTKEEDRGKNVAGEIRRCLESRGHTFDIDKANEFNLAGHKGKDPTFVALPLRSKSFRGRHPKWIICDDIITPDDCSAAERRKVEAVWAELIKLSPNICLIGQPAHAADIYAKMRALSGVRKLELPYGTIPELDADLEAQRAAGVSEASIDASYYLTIRASERMPFATIKKVPFFPRGGCAGFIDPSHEGIDYTAFALGAMNFDRFVVVGFAWPKAWDDCIEDIKKVYNAYQCARFGFETNGLGKHPVLMLRKEGANVREWKSTDNKHGRILNAAMFRKHLDLSTFIPDSIKTSALIGANEVFNKMVIEYEYKAEHDDAPDALANLMEMLGMVKK